jgi:hypothetical protein
LKPCFPTCLALHKRPYGTLIHGNFCIIGPRQLRIPTKLSDLAKNRKRLEDDLVPASVVAPPTKASESTEDINPSDFKRPKIDCGMNDRSFEPAIFELHLRYVHLYLIF